MKKSLLKTQGLKSKIKALGSAIKGLIIAEAGDGPIDRLEANRLFLRLAKDQERFIAKLEEIEGKK